MLAKVSEWRICILVSFVLNVPFYIFQINFFKDHTKIILCPRMQAVTFIDSERRFRTFPFNLIEICGCAPDLAEHLQYAHTTVERMVMDKIKKDPAAVAVTNKSSNPSDKLPAQKTSSHKATSVTAAGKVSGAPRPAGSAKSLKTAPLAT